MIKLQYIFIYLLTSIIISSQAFSQWTIQQYWPYYQDSYFISGTSTGYLLCDNSTVRKTTNGGASWENQQTSSTGYFLDIFFMNTATGWTVGQNGIIRVTTNGGMNWNSQNSGTSYDLHSVNFANANTGFIATQSGVLKTTNGGINWGLSSINPVLFRAVAFKDVNTGIICGHSGYAYTTTNSGLNWTLSTTGTSEILENLVYTELSTFYAGTSGGKILKTTNSGTNWQIITTGNTEQIASLNFSNALTGYFCSDNGKIYKTTNSGVNWVNVYNNSLLTLSSVGSFSAGGSGVIVSGYNGILLKSTDYGSNWNVIDGYPNSDAIGALSFVNSLTGYGADYNGLIYKTTNSGANWLVISTFTDCYFYKMNFVNITTGFVTGDSTDGPAIWKTTNSGLSWLRKDAPNYSELYCVYFVNENTGFACGGNQADSGPELIKTTNAGNNWSVLYKTSSQINDIYFIDVNTGWGCSDDGKIYKTSNSGTNWTVYTTPASGYLNSVHFVNNSTGYVCGEDGVVIKSVNSGMNWSLILPGTISNLNSVKFGNASNGCVVGENGTRFITTNGGNSWINHQENIGADLISAYFSTASVVYTAGYYGIISNYDLSLVNINANQNEEPSGFVLQQNYPNPFNPVTNIDFTIPQTGNIELVIYDLKGSLVKTIAAGNYSIGNHSLDINLSAYSSGVYFYTLIFKTDSKIYRDTKKMILIK